MAGRGHGQNGARLQVGLIRKCMKRQAKSWDSAGQQRDSLLFPFPTFVPVDVAQHFVLRCNYTGKEVVE
jgi:hypothetical protein